MNKNWIYRKFEDCLEKVKYTSKISTSDYLEEGKYPIVSQEEGLIAGFWNKEDDVFRTNKPIVIFGDHTRILKYVNFDFVLGADGVKILQPIDGLSAKFLFYYLQWCNIPSLGYSRHYKLLKEIVIPIPNSEFQSRIVSELDLLQSIIDKQKAQLKELDNLAQSIFYDMFGDPVENEKGWKTIAWKDLFDTILGKMLDVKKQNSNDERRCYLGNTNVQWCSFELNNLKTMTFSNKEIEKFSLKKGDILICEGGESGRCAVWEKENSDILFQKAIHRARVKSPDTIEPHYIPFLMKKIRENNGLKNYVSQATIEHLTGEKLKQLSIIVPPFSLQQSFATKIESIEKQKAAISKSIEETQKLFDYTMDKYFG
ncbi:MAG: restriction endonuclease subunit S [Bacteroidales bacterium]|nr:restriction endonuclease subunit S [Bacteroidales bacterium]